MKHKQHKPIDSKGAFERSVVVALACLASIGLTGCGADPGGSADEHGPAKASTQELAKFYLESGKQAIFTEVRLGDEVGVFYEETGPIHSAPTFGDAAAELDTLDLYLRLAPAQIAVPRALVQSLDEAGQATASVRLGGRQLVDAMQVPILAAPTLEPRGEDHETGGWNCSQDASDFEDFACSGSGTSIEYCDSGQWFNLQRSSGDATRKKSLGLFVACGTEVQIRHSYADCCNWHELHDAILPSSHWMWSRYTGLAKWRRRINYDRVSQFSGSYLRAYSAFYN